MPARALPFARLGGSMDAVQGGIGGARAHPLAGGGSRSREGRGVCVVRRGMAISGLLPTKICAAAILVGALAGCAGGPKLGTPGPKDGVIDPVTNADLTARFPAPIGGTTGGVGGAGRPMLYPGSELEAVPGGAHAEAREGGVASATEGRLGRFASADGATVGPSGGVEINFEGADIQTVAKTLLGDILGLNFVVDPRVQGAVTLVSVGPIPRKDVLGVFESVLRMSNAAIVREGSLVKIVPIPEAGGSGTVTLGTGPPGFGVAIVPLRYTSAVTVARTAENFLSRPGSVRVDQSRNLLLIQGTTNERQAALEMIASFDVEWLRNQSVGVYPLKSTSPETMIHELERVFEAGEGGQGQGVIKFQPISRMNAVMVVARTPKFLEQATNWVHRLDRSDTTGTTVRVYRLKYGTAVRVARILNEIFLGGQRGSLPGDGTAPSSTAPGTTAGRSRLDAISTESSFGRTTGGASGSTVTAGSTTTTAATTRTGGAAGGFEGFGERRDQEGAGPGAGPAGAGTDTGGAGRGIFPNARITADASENAIVIYSNQEDYRVIERAVHELDRPQLQVAIDAMVAEVTLNDNLQYGVQYFFKSSDVGMAADKGSIGLFPAAAANAATTSATTTTQTAVQAAFLQRVLPGFNLLLGPEAQPRVILNALSTVTDVKVLSAPSLVVMDNQPAVLQVGNEVPVSTGTATVLASGSPVVNTTDYRSTGVILKVMPHVHANGTIQLELEQEISNVVGSTAASLTPTISQRKIHSTVSVTSGQTVLLGGLISESRERDATGLPILNQIKYLGDLFGNKSVIKSRSEIVVFIKPQLIRDSVDASTVAQEFRERLDTMRRGEPPLPAAPPPVRK